jgi:hypothetical protein
MISAVVHPSSLPLLDGVRRSLPSEGRGCRPEGSARRVKLRGERLQMPRYEHLPIYKKAMDLTPIL